VTTLPFKRLATWSHKLDACIRCGYCYEFCPVFRSTRWEQDAPRGKLILLSGLLHGQLDASETVTDRIFSCFFCKRCESGCSSGIPFTEILADARADLADMGLDAPGTLSYNEHARCSRCLSCVRSCPHEARRLVDDQVVVDPAACQSCGLCLDVCPALNIRLAKSFDADPDRMRGEIQRFFSGPAAAEAKVVVFACTWSNVPGLESARLETSRPETPEYQVQVTACAGRLPSQLIMDALQAGAWGVLVNGCPEDECEHKSGSHEARKRVSAVRDLLRAIGMDPSRVQFVEVSKGDTQTFSRKVDGFLRSIRSLGPAYPSRASG